jgi:N-acetylmuramoyl-L-alanine amidase
MDTAERAGNKGIHRRRILAGAVLAALSLFIVAGAQAAPGRAQSSANSTNLTIKGVAYVDARIFLPRYGLKSASWVKTGERMRFQGPNVRIELETDKRDVVFNGRRVLLGDPVVFYGSSLYISRIDAEKLFAPLLNPDGAYSPPVPAVRVIAIDAGHGGQDTGTQNKALKVNEKTFTLDVALRLRALLKKAGYRVVMTRTDDRFIPLPDRAEIANKAGADLFISIHFNSVENAPAVLGTETFAMTPQYQRSTATSPSEKDPGARVGYPGNRNDPWNAVLGYCIQNHLLAKLGTEDRGFKRARFAVLRLVNAPAVLVESGYLSNAAEARKICTAAYRDDIAEGIAAGIKAYAAATAAAKGK